MPAPHCPSPTRSTVIFAAALAALTAFAGAAEAQNQPGTTPATPSAPLQLAAEPFRLDSAGLSIYLPDGAIAQTTRAGETAAVQIVPGGENPAWVVNLNTPRSTNTQRTAAEVADEVLNQLLASVGILDRKIDGKGIIVDRLVSTKGTVIQPVTPLELAGTDPAQRRPASRFYVRLPRGEGETAVIRGYTIFQTGPGRFVTLDLITTEPHFPAARRIYETFVATTRFEDTTNIAATRGAAIEAGIDFFSQLTPSDYEAAIAAAKDQWYRLASQGPGTSDVEAEERAYRRIRAWKGARGELDLKGSRNNWSAGDHQQGYIVRVDARMLQNPSARTGEHTVIDSVATYFMTPDRREEAWIIQMAIREPGRRSPAVHTETGARSGSSMSVTTTGTGRENVAASPFIPEQGYATQVENVLLPYLLAQGTVSGELGFYLYQSDTNSVRLRRDAVERHGETITITTRHNEDRDPQVSTFKNDGTLISTAVPDKTTWTPITLQRLAQLWRSKGLPMD